MNKNREPKAQSRFSERPFLREAEAGQSHPVGGLGDLHLDRGRIGCGDLGGTQDRVVAENFAVNLGDHEILTACILTPDLPEFNVLDGHKFFL